MKKLYSAQDAIEQAIEGGYDIEGYTTNLDAFSDLKNATMLDPLFWQALGKARGWTEVLVGNGGIVESDGRVLSQGFVPEWKMMAHDWLSMRFDGDENKFWQSLP
jgi:hypothetical protein